MVRSLLRVTRVAATVTPLSPASIARPIFGVAGLATRAKATINSRTFSSAVAAGEAPTAVKAALAPKDLMGILENNGFGFFTGVPDSLLKDLCAYITDHTSPEQHIIAASEGASVGIAAGYHIGTGKPAVVYLQNSGLGNAVNPLLSLADPQVYSIPMLVIIGWRGAPGVKDEPQHRGMGAVQNGMLQAMGVPFEQLPSDAEAAAHVLQKLTAEMNSKQGPVALLVPKGTFEAYKSAAMPASESPLPLTRRAVVEAVLTACGEATPIVGTTGYLSRELYGCREAAGHDHSRDFLCVGSMGHAVAIAEGLLTARPELPVVCLDGDGASLMHLGSAAVLGAGGRAKRLLHVVANNGAHESVGGQPTVGHNVEFAAVAAACGYKHAQKVETPEALAAALAEGHAMTLAGKGPVLLDVRCRIGGVEGPRPKTTPVENKEAFMSRFALK